MDEEQRTDPDERDEAYEPPAYELIGAVDELTMGGTGVTDDATALQPGSVT